MIAKKKKAARGPLVKSPGDDLLSHEETSHYHRRWSVSLLSSRWSQVVPNRYGRQEKRYSAGLITSQVGKDNIR